MVSALTDVQWVCRALRNKVPLFHQFKPIALTRPESVDKESYQDLVRRGVSVKPANFQDIEGLVSLLTGADVVIFCLTLL